MQAKGFWNTFAGYTRGITNLLRPFSPRFERELMESDGAVWPDYFKISYLERALNAKIADYLVIMNPDRQSYPDFIRVIQ